MAIKNINTIQNPDDLAFIQESTKEYVLQSLANLGQRIGVAGDGVKITDFTFSDIVDGGEFNSSEYVGYISVNDNNVINLSIREKKNLDNVVKSIDVDNTDGYVITTGIIELDTVINGIEGYYPNGMIITDDNYYTVSFAGYANNTAKEYICEKFHKTENIIDSALRLTKYNNALELFYLYIEDNGTYTLELYKENEDNHRDITTYIEYIQSMSPSVISPAYIVKDATIDNFFTSDGIFHGITYSVETNTFIFPEGADLTNKPNIKKYLQFFVYDLTYLYRFMKSYYSETVFKENNYQFKRQIVANLFKMIISNSTTATDLWVPLNYVFNYACNNANEWQIYYNTTDVIVKYTPDNIDSDYIIENSEQSSLLCFTEKQERAILYNYSVNYDPENSSNVYDINVFKHYVLPYIDGDGYWVLNDYTTNIYAKGRDAGNPNIIIVESHEDTYTIVSGANKDTLLSQIDWVRQVAYIQPLERVNVDDLKLETQYNWFKTNFWVPSIKDIPTQKRDEWINLLTNSLIINIADISCIDYSNNVEYTAEDVIERYGANGVLTTMWVLNDDKTEYDYLRRQDNDTCAADFNYITNMNNLIAWSINNYEPKHPDKYQHSNVTFDASYVALKNNTSETRTYIYPNIQNKQSGNYNTTNYNNDFNFIVKYNDIVEDGLNNNIETIQQSANVKYFETSYNKGVSTTENIVTNSLYTYTNGKTKYKYNEYVPNYNVPSIDLGEVLTRNETLLNRLNIMSFDKYGTAYYSYIGSSYEGDKSIFVLGTSDTNINIGTETMINDSERNTFIPQHEIDVNFDNTHITGYAYIHKDLNISNDIVLSGINWTKYESKINDSVTVTYWTASVIPTGRYIYEVNDKMRQYSADETYSYTGLLNLNRDVVSSHIANLANEYVYKYASEFDKLYVIDTVPELYMDGNGNYAGIHSIYIGDGLYIPTLLKKLKLDEYLQFENNVLTADKLDITSNMDIYKYNGAPVVLQSSKTMLLPDKYRYVKNDIDGVQLYGEEISDFTYNTFKGNELTLTYYVSGDVLHLNIDECKVCNNMTYVNKIIKEY